MDSPARIIKEVLIELGEISEPSDGGAWPGFVGATVDTNTNTCTVCDTTPILDGRIVRTGERITHYGVQIFLTALVYDIGWAKFKDVIDVVNNIRNKTAVVDGVPHLVINAKKMSAAHVGVDERRRQLFSANFLVTIN